MNSKVKFVHSDPKKYRGDFYRQPFKLDYFLNTFLKNAILFFLFVTNCQRFEIKIIFRNVLLRDVIFLIESIFRIMHTINRWSCKANFGTSCLLWKMENHVGCEWICYRFMALCDFFYKRKSSRFLSGRPKTEYV